MRTQIKLPENDICIFCDGNCPDNIYDCEILNKAQEQIKRFK